MVLQMDIRQSYTNVNVQDFCTSDELRQLKFDLEGKSLYITYNLARLANKSYEFFIDSVGFWCN